MKKVYLSIAILAVSGSLFAQAPTAQRELFSIKKINNGKSQVTHNGQTLAFPHLVHMEQNTFNNAFNS